MNQWKKKFLTNYWLLLHSSAKGRHFLKSGRNKCHVENNEACSRFGLLSVCWFESVSFDLAECCCFTSSLTPNQTFMSDTTDLQWALGMKSTNINIGGEELWKHIAALLWRISGRRCKHFTHDFDSNSTSKIRKILTFSGGKQNKSATRYSKEYPELY